MFACLEVSRFFLAYISKLMSLPYCFHSFSKKCWNHRDHIILEYFKIVLLIAK